MPSRDGQHHSLIIRLTDAGTPSSRSLDTKKCQPVLEKNRTILFDLQARYLALLFSEDQMNNM